MIQLPDELNLIVSLALLALIPFIAMMATSFVKLAVVFSLLRNALGVQQIPPNMALYGLAIILSIFIMAPVGFETYDYVKANEISLEDSASVEGLIESGMQPYREFLKNIFERQKPHFSPMLRELYGRKSTSTDLNLTAYCSYCLHLPSVNSLGLLK
ncbi:type III secretion system protein YscR [Vibrio tubiashii ATCC 19109]|uniref:Type III secretion system protein YscR n=1 Tax=Vibrio tubiashii ATCC 19109 TaxID=1051646 RepID=A0ABP2LJL7_9VIBR|nr:type III secretion system protein YscR [Vibrio tubiashii ATCC 19109]